jgi:hypothetical protein
MYKITYQSDKRVDAFTKHCESLQECVNHLFYSFFEIRDNLIYDLLFDHCVTFTHGKETYTVMLEEVDNG